MGFISKMTGRGAQAPLTKEQQDQQLLGGMLELLRSAEKHPGLYLSKLGKSAFDWRPGCYNYLIKDPEDGRTIMHHAAILGVNIFDEENFIYPGKNQANKTCRDFEPGDKFCFTPVHYAILNGHMSLLKSFLILLETRNDKTPFARHPEHGGIKVTVMLVFYYADCKEKHDQPLSDEQIKDLLSKPYHELVTVIEALQRGLKIQPSKADVGGDRIKLLVEFNQRCQALQAQPQPRHHYARNCHRFCATQTPPTARRESAASAQDPQPPSCSF